MAARGGGGDGLRRRGGGGGGGDSWDDGSKPRRPRVTLESFDLYQKVQPDEAAPPTAAGAGVSVVALLCVAALVAGEASGALWPTRQEHVSVDPIVEGRLRINLDVTFHALSCGEANLDAMDVAGEQQNGLDHDVIKTRLTPEGVPIGEGFAAVIGNSSAAGPEPTPLPEGYCGPCYGAERPGPDGKSCCNTCDAVRAAYSERGWDASDVSRNSEQCQRERSNP
jgi:hypothetical protein